VVNGIQNFFQTISSRKIDSSEPEFAKPQIAKTANRRASSPVSPSSKNERLNETPFSSSC